MLKTAPCSPVNADAFQHIHKVVPMEDSPYVMAKNAQVIDRDPIKAISFFWWAIHSGDRVDHALKDMAIVMKKLNWANEAIEAIKSFRHLCSIHSQDSLDDMLIELYKRCGRLGEQIELLQHKLKLIEEGLAFRGKSTKAVKSHGKKKFPISTEQEKSRLLGNLAWAYMLQTNYQTAEEIYRKALFIEPDKNKQCNLAVCLMQRGKFTEAKSLLQDIRPSPEYQQLAELPSYIKSFDRASELLVKLESIHILSLLN